MHQEFVAPSKKFADIIIPHGAENTVAIGFRTKPLLPSSKREKSFYKILSFKLLPYHTVVSKVFAESKVSATSSGCLPSNVLCVMDN